MIPCMVLLADGRSSNAAKRYLQRSHSTAHHPSIYAVLRMANLED